MLKNTLIIFLEWCKQYLKPGVVDNLIRINLLVSISCKLHFSKKWSHCVVLFSFYAVSKYKSFQKLGQKEGNIFKHVRVFFVWNASASQQDFLQEEERRSNKKQIKKRSGGTRLESQQKFPFQEKLSFLP
jgi:hypothetical protein